MWELNIHLIMSPQHHVCMNIPKCFQTIMNQSFPHLMVITLSVDARNANPEILLLPIIPLINCFKMPHKTSLVIYSCHLWLIFNCIAVYILSFFYWERRERNKKGNGHNWQAAQRNSHYNAQKEIVRNKLRRYQHLFVILYFKYNHAIGHQFSN